MTIHQRFFRDERHTTTKNKNIDTFFATDIHFISKISVLFASSQSVKTFAKSSFTYFEFDSVMSEKNIYSCNSSNSPVFVKLQNLQVRMMIASALGREIWKLHSVNRKTGYREIQTIFFTTRPYIFFNVCISINLEYSIIILFSDLWSTSWQQIFSKNRISMRSHAFRVISINNCKHQLGHDTKYYCPVASSIKSNEKRLNNDRSPFSHFQGLPSDCCKLMPPLVVHFSK